MSVNAINFTTWLSTQPAEVKNLTQDEQIEKFIQFKQTAETTGDKGTVVEQGNEEPLTEEQKAAKDAVATANNAEVAAMKEAAAQQAGTDVTATQQEAKQGVYKPEVLPQEMNNILDGVVQNSKDKDKPFYKNSNAQKIYKKSVQDTFTKTLQKEYDDAIAAENAKGDKADKKLIKALEEQKKLAGKVGDKVADAITEYAKTGNKIEHTRMFKNDKEKKELKAKVSTEEGYLRWKKHNADVISENDVMLHEIMKRDNCSEHEAFMKMIDGVSGDFLIEKNELETAASNTQTPTDSETRRELKKAGYKINSDLWENVALAAVVGAGSGLAASAIPVIANAVANATATATAKVFDETGKVIAQATETVTDSANAGGAIFPWQNGLAGGATAAILSGLLFGDDVKEDDVLRTDPHNISFNKNDVTKYYKNKQFENNETTQFVLDKINELPLSENEKVDLLVNAAGKNGQVMLSSKELLLALYNGMEKAKQGPVLSDEIEEIDDNIEIEDIQVDIDKMHIAEQPLFRNYTIQKGDYLYAIARDLYGLKDGDKALNTIMNEICKASGYKRGTNMVVGEKLTIPDVVTVDGKEYRAINDKATPGRVEENGLDTSHVKARRSGEYYIVEDENGETDGKRYKTEEEANMAIVVEHGAEHDKSKDKTLPPKEEVEYDVVTTPAAEEFRTKADNAVKEAKELGITVDKTPRTKSELDALQNQIDAEKARQKAEAEAEAKKARIKEIETELNNPIPMIDPEYVNELKKEYKELTGNDYPEPNNPSGVWDPHQRPWS